MIPHRRWNPQAFTRHGMTSHIVVEEPQLLTRHGTDIPHSSGGTPASSTKHGTGSPHVMEPQLVLPDMERHPTISDMEQKST